MTVWSLNTGLSLWNFRKFSDWSQSLMTRILTVKAFIKEVQSKNQYEKIGCIDFGMKRIGLATTDEMKQYAFPMGSIVVRQPPKTEESLSDLNRQMQEFTVKQNVRYWRICTFYFTASLYESWSYHILMSWCSACHIIDVRIVRLTTFISVVSTSLVGKTWHYLSLLQVNPAIYDPYLPSFLCIQPLLLHKFIPDIS